VKRAGGVEADVLGPALGVGAGAAPEADASGPVHGAGPGASLAGGELWHGSVKGHGEAVPAGYNDKGGWTTMLVGNREKSQGLGWKWL